MDESKINSNPPANVIIPLERTESDDNPLDLTDEFRDLQKWLKNDNAQYIYIGLQGFVEGFKILMASLLAITVVVILNGYVSDNARYRGEGAQWCYIFIACGDECTAGLIYMSQSKQCLSLKEQELSIPRVDRKCLIGENCSPLGVVIIQTLGDGLFE